MEEGEREGATSVGTQGDSDNEQKIKMDESSSEKNADIKTPEPGPQSSRPGSTTSSHRAKSSASGEIVFEAKKKKKRGGSAAVEDDAYTVTFTVSIAMAIPTGTVFNMHICSCK